MKLASLDREIASVYAPEILKTIKYGENGVFFWLPSCGMTTVVKDIFGNKELLTKHLDGLTGRLKIIQLWGHLADKKTLDSLLDGAGYVNLSSVKDDFELTLAKGKEIVCVVSGIDDFPINVKAAIYKALLKFTSLNNRRVHIILNLRNKPQFEKILSDNPNLMPLCNKMVIMPIINGELLIRYIRQKAKGYGFEISSGEIARITTTYGGILQLTKEYLRSGGKLDLLELKLKSIWNLLPLEYKDRLLNIKSRETDRAKLEIDKDLEKFGIKRLLVFDKHSSVLISNPQKILPLVLTKQELKLWKYLENHTGEFIEKEKIISIIRPANPTELSLWALDQAISRFRKKLAKAGVDPELLRTIKGKGYRWV